MIIKSVKIDKFILFYMAEINNYSEEFVLEDEKEVNHQVEDEIKIDDLS